MKAPRRSRQINQGRLIDDVAAVKQVGRLENAAPPLKLDLSPVIGRLKDHLAVRLRL
jgi:hypothetical protein